MRVLVTGAGGLVGRECLRCLAEQGHEVVTLSRRAAPCAPVAVAAALTADLLDRTAMARAVAKARAEGLIHLAWHDGPDRMGAAQNRLWPDASLALVQAFADAGGGRVVAAGSCAEYDWRRPGPFVETMPGTPQSIYGTEKARAAVTLGAAARRLNLRLSWARIFFVYGPGEAPGRLLADLIAHLRAGREAPCTDGRQRRDYMAARDVARALVHLLAHPADGPVNIATGQAIAVRDLIETAAGVLGRPDLVRLGARKRPPGDPDEIVADITRLQNLGFVPEFDLARGLADAIARSP